MGGVEVKGKKNPHGFPLTQRTEAGFSLTDGIRSIVIGAQASRKHSSVE
jgi:hypothetical protein